MKGREREKQDLVLARVGLTAVLYWWYRQQNTLLLSSQEHTHTLTLCSYRGTF